MTRSRQNPSQMLDGFLIAILSTTFAALYLHLRTNLHTYDSIDYFTIATRSRHLWNHLHPHHLLYHFLLLGVRHLVGLSPWKPSDPFFPYIVPAAVFGGFTVGAVYLLARYMMNIRWAVMVALGTGFSYSMIFMGTDVEKYTISVFFLLLAYLITTRPSSHGISSRICAGVSVATGALIHQAALMFVFVLGIHILMGDQRRDLRWRDTGILLFTAFLLVLTAYLLTGWLHPAMTVTGALSWSASYPASGVWGKGFSEPGTDWLAGQFAAVSGFIYTENIRSILGTWRPVTTVLPVGYGVVIAAAIWGMALARSRQWVTPLFVWSVSYIAFIIWWEPENTKVAVLYIPGLWLFLGYGLSRFGIERRLKKLDSILFMLVVAFIVCLADLNVSWASYRARPGADVFRATAERIMELTRPEDLVIVPVHSTADRYLTQIYNRSQTISLVSVYKTMNDVNEFRVYMDQALNQLCSHSSGRIFICGRACDPVGKDPPGGLTNQDVRAVMMPILSYCDYIADLPDGDRLFQMNMDAICRRYQ